MVKLHSHTVTSSEPQQGLGVGMNKLYEVIFFLSETFDISA